MNEADGQQFNMGTSNIHGATNQKHPYPSTQHLSKLATGAGCIPGHPPVGILTRVTPDTHSPDQLLPRVQNPDCKSLLKWKKRKKEEEEKERDEEEGGEEEVEGDRQLMGRITTYYKYKIHTDILLPCYKAEQYYSLK